MLVQVKDSKVVKIGLPREHVFEGGAVLYDLDLLPHKTLKEYGWLPLEDVEPIYDEESQVIKKYGYDIQEDKVVQKYRIFNLEESETPSFYSMAVMNLVAQSIREDELSEEEINELINVYPQWQPDEALEGGDYRRYEGNVYQVIDGKGHTTQADWLPSEQPSLYNKVAPKGIIAEWKQPAGSHDAYQLGDKVIYQGTIYISTHDGGNTWKPTEHGWKIEGDDN